MKNLENYKVQQLSMHELENINGGIEYFSWATYPTDGNGNIVVNSGTILGVAIQNTGVIIANAGIAVANGAIAAWNWLTD